MSNSGITYHDVVSYFKTCDLELGELVLQMGTQELGKRHATRGKIAAGVARSKAAKVAPATGNSDPTIPTAEAPHGYKADGTPRLRAPKGSKSGQVAQAAQAAPVSEAPAAQDEQEVYEASA